MSELVQTLRKENTKETLSPVFQVRTILPIIGVSIALITEILIPAHAKLKYANLPHYRYFLFIALGVTILLSILSVFWEALREKLNYRGAFVGGVFIFLTFLKYYVFINEDSDFYITY